MLISFFFQNTLRNREFKNNFHVLNCMLSNVDSSRSEALTNFVQIIILSNFFYRVIHSRGNLCMRATNENRKYVFFAFFSSSNETSMKIVIVTSDKNMRLYFKKKK